MLVVTFVNQKYLYLKKYFLKRLNNTVLFNNILFELIKMYLTCLTLVFSVCGEHNTSMSFLCQFTLHSLEHILPRSFWNFNLYKI